LTEPCCQATPDGACGERSRSCALTHACAQRHENLDAIFSKEAAEERSKDRKQLTKLLGQSVKLQQMEQSGDCFYAALETAYEKSGQRVADCLPADTVGRVAIRC
jgi:hypothetical protein